MLDCEGGRGRNKSEPVLSIPLGVQCGPNTEIVPGISDGTAHIKDIQKQYSLLWKATYSRGKRKDLWAKMLKVKLWLWNLTCHISLVPLFFIDKLDVTL